MWKFQDSSDIQILREINFGRLKPQKMAILTIWAALNLEILDIFDIFLCKIPKKSKFKASKMVEMTGFDPLNSAKIDFT